VNRPAAGLVAVAVRAASLAGVVALGLGCLAQQDAWLAPVERHTSPPWLREVARITVPTERVVAAAVSANGCVLATVAADGLVRVRTIGTWRESSAFVVPVRNAVRARIEGEDTLLVATAESELAFRLADGARVYGDWPAAGTPAPATPGLRALARDAQIVSGNPARGPLVIASDGILLLWHLGSVYELSSTLRAAWLTADGAHVLCARSIDLLVQPVAGGAPWRVPGLGDNAQAAACGPGSMFVAVDRHHLVVADAATRTVRLAADLDEFGVPAHPPSLVAAENGGARVLLGQDRYGDGIGWWLDLKIRRAARLHVGPCVAAWAGDELLLFDHGSIRCVSDPGRWVRFAEPTATSPAWAMASDSAWGSQIAAAIVPGGGEVVVAHWNEASPGVALSRCDASDGTVRASATVGDDDWYGSLSIVGDHVLVHSLFDSTLELRRLDTLQPVGKASLPRRADRVRVCGAAHASRIAVQSPDDVVVFDVLPERAAK
jgi:hypothetical protein